MPQNERCIFYPFADRMQDNEQNQENEEVCFQWSGNLFISK